MGLLKKSKCLQWPQILNLKEKLKSSAAHQFIQKYTAKQHITTPEKLWGDELEFMIVGKINDQHHLLLIAQQIRELYKNDKEFLLNPEFAAYMLETTPREPYNYPVSELHKVEQNMLARIHAMDFYINEAMKKIGMSGFPLFCTVYPMLGAKNVFYDLKGKFQLSFKNTQSKLFPDNAIAEHPRYHSFHANVINRRGRPPDGRIKVMSDKNTPGDSHIRIDSFGLGMGCCCLHTTFQAESVGQATYLFDQLGAVAPLLLRITRASPIAQGCLLDTETRWDILAFAADCRTDGERGAATFRPGEVLDSEVPRSRFSSIDSYISSDERNLAYYNDVKVPLHVNAKNKLLEAGIPENLSVYVASLLARDPLLVYEDAADDMGDFLNIQTSNWKSVRLKAPNGHGWKVEFRVMEVQPTAFENAAFSVFMYLLTGAIAKFQLNFYIPISLVDENFRRANRFIRQAGDYKSKLGEDKLRLFYRINIFDKGRADIGEGTVNEIFNGVGQYRGIIPLVREFVGDGSVDRYLDFVSKRCAGEYMSVADWLRKIVITHGDYKNDSRISGGIESFILDEYKRVKEENDVGYLRDK